MFTVDDTIVAIATPVGRGGIGVVRVSGPDAARIAATLTGSTRTLEPRQATFGRIEVGGVVGHATTADQVIVTFFPSPHSYTGEDVVEISGHGSPLLLRSIVSAAIEAGARLAEPGEFTFRAFLRERIDLVQAEAVRDLIDAVTPLQARAAYDQLEGTLTGRIKATDQRLFDLTVRLEASLDFPEEGYHFVGSGDASREIGEVAAAIDELLVSAARGRLVREGLQAALVGRPNAGKSSLFNALAGAGRAIVTDIPGTTRDLLTEIVDVDGIPLTLVDTAGIREGAADPIEREGINRALAARDVAHLLIVVLDRSQPLTPDDRAILDATARRARVVVASKSDLVAVWSSKALDVDALDVSAKTGEGMDRLRRAIVSTAGGDVMRDVPAITNIRHVDLLQRARAALSRASDAAAAQMPEEFVVADVTEARRLLEEVTGARTPDDVLRAIFERFCIGK